MGFMLGVGVEHGADTAVIGAGADGGAGLVDGGGGDADEEAETGDGADFLYGEIGLADVDTVSAAISATGERVFGPWTP